MEMIVNNEMTYFLERHQLLSASQSGFRRKDSTVCQLISIVHNLLNNATEKKQSRMIFLDISKAFDRVWHARLLSKLHNLGFTGALLNFLRDYLANREICVVIDGQKSTWHKINAGVPQGAILAPLLFLCFTNDLPEGLQCIVKMFADDTSLLSNDEDNQKIQSDLIKLENWAHQNDVIFNADKTKYVWFGKPKNTRHDTVSFLGEEIATIEQHKHLGIIIHQSLSWEAEVLRICTKMHKLVNMMRPLKGVLPRRALEIIYKCYIRPHAEYGANILGTLPAVLNKKLEQVQDHAGLVVSGLPKTTSYNKVLDELSWSTLVERQKVMRLVLLHKIIKGISPRYPMNILDNACTVTNTDRPNLRRMLPTYEASTCGRQQYMMRSFFPATILDWNNLHDDIINATTLTTF